MRHLILRTLMVVVLLLAAGASIALAQGGPIVYNKPGLLTDVWLINPDGSGDQQIPVNLVTAEVPVWSRDGQLIAATGEVPEAGEQAGFNIFVFDPTGANLLKVTDFPVTPDQFPVSLFKAFSPEGQRLAFVLFERVRQAVLLLLIRLDGTELIFVGGGAISGLTGFGVDWSPIMDDLIVPVATVDFSSGFPLPVTALFRVPPVPEVLGFCPWPGPFPPCQQATFPRASFSLFEDDTFPVFSPDGTQAAFVRRISEPLGGLLGSSIRVVNVDGTNEREVIAFPGEVVYGVSWSPDGTRLVFDQGEVISGIEYPGSLGLWMIYIDGTDLVQVQVGPAAFPSWNWVGTMSPLVSSASLP